MTSKSPKSTVVSVGIVCNGDDVLLIKRAKKESNLLWQFPAGKVEVGESSKDASEREVLEETGIKCEAFKKLGERPTQTRELIFITEHVIT